MLRVFKLLRILKLCVAFAAVAATQLGLSYAQGGGDDELSIEIGEEVEAGPRGACILDATRERARCEAAARASSTGPALEDALWKCELEYKITVRFKRSCIEPPQERLECKNHPRGMCRRNFIRCELILIDVFNVCLHTAVSKEEKRACQEARDCAFEACRHEEVRCMEAAPPLPRKWG